MICHIRLIAFVSSVLIMATLGCRSGSDTAKESAEEPAVNDGDPYAPATWIPMLEDPSEVKNAVTQLQRLKDEPGIEAAIVPLGKAWETQDRPKRILQVIVDIAESGRGGPHWPLAVPVLKTALAGFDESDQKSIETAIVAADALGRSQLVEVVPDLARVATREMKKLSSMQRVRLAAIAGLGHFVSDPRAVAALIEVMSAERDAQPPQLFAAAALALAEARSPEAIEPLLVKLFEIPPIYDHCRRALVAIGPAARDRVLAIFQGQDPRFEELARKEKYNVACDVAMGPDTSCQAPTNLQYKSALLLGDFHAIDAVAPLLEGLRAPPMPAFFESGIPGPPQHTAILEALKQIGDPAAAEPVWAFATNKGIDPALLPVAMDTHSHLARNADALPRLARWITDDDEDEAVRLAAGVAYGRLARSTDAYKPLLFMRDRYRKEAEKHEKRAQKVRDAIARLESGDAKNRAADGDAVMAKKREELSGHEMRVTAYRGFQRAFEYDLARAHTGTTCADDIACYTSVLDKSADEIGAMMSGYIQDRDKWTSSDQMELHHAALERALMELRKAGPAARASQEKLLELVDSRDRGIRQGVHMALVAVAAVPCDACVERMDRVLEEQRDQTTLQSLTNETQVVRNYFLWAGR